MESLMFTGELHAAQNATSISFWSSSCK